VNARTTPASSPRLRARTAVPLPMNSD
jgi:hypothetical protein